MLSKYIDGMTWREAKRKRSLERTAKRKAAKVTARSLDGGRCRWPHCECRTLGLSLESAHLKALGMGGNPDSSRDDPRNLITLCIETHRTGRLSLHKGTRKIVPLTDEGTRGPCEFWQDDEHGQMYLVARERAPFVYIKD